MERKQKQTWVGIMLIRTFVLKVMNDERKILNDHVMIDRVAEKTESVITQVCKKQKLWILLNLTAVKFLIFLFI